MHAIASVRRKYEKLRYAPIIAPRLCGCTVSECRAKKKFSRLVTQWSRAEEECREAYMAWQVACRRREKLAIDKNNAWGELEMERARLSQQLEAKP